MSIILGLIAGTILCVFLSNSNSINSMNFIKPFIIFVFVFSFVVFLYLSIKNSYVSFMQKNPSKFLFETLFIGLLT